MRQVDFRLIVTLAIPIALLAAPSSHATTRERAVAETVLHNSNERLSVGASHACEVQGDGTVRCWGNNTYGQLGDGTTTRRLTPVIVPGFNGAVAVASGAAHTCALFSLSAGSPSSRHHDQVGRVPRRRSGRR